MNTAENTIIREGLTIEKETSFISFKEFIQYVTGSTYEEIYKDYIKKLLSERFPTIGIQRPISSQGETSHD